MNFKLLNALEHLLKGTIFVSLALMVIFVFLNVVLRYMFNSGLAWSGEVARYLFVWIIFLGSVIAVKEQSHLGVDILVSKLNLSVQKDFIYSLESINWGCGKFWAWIGLVGVIELDAGIGRPKFGIPVN